MKQHHIYMERCITLAKQSLSATKTNPQVGAVIVYNGKIIGEGYHEFYGGPHAEVNAVNSVAKEDFDKIKDSTLYVSLEPCNIHGKTPPCAQMILKYKIKNLVIGCEDPNPKMAGSSLEFLENNGVKITKGVLQDKCEALIRAFKTNMISKRPYVILKFAQSKDNFLGKSGQQIWLSNQFSKVLSHKLRAEADAILIGRTTALTDDPSLTNRLFYGTSPIRIIIDQKNDLPDHLSLFADPFPTIVISEKEKSWPNKIKSTLVLDFDENLLDNLLRTLYRKKNIGKLLIEGGRFTLLSFIKKNCWDEAVVIKTDKILKEGIKAPTLSGKLIEKFNLGKDEIIRLSNPDL